MGFFLEMAIPIKRNPNPLLQSSSSYRSFFHWPRSRLARFLLFEKIDYLQWVLFASAFFFVLILFQNFLPGSVIEEKGKGVLEEIRVLDFGEGIRFEPTKLVEKWERERREVNGTRFGVRRPKIALVVAELSVDGVQMEMISVAAVLMEMGYDIEVSKGESGRKFMPKKNLTCNRDEDILTSTGSLSFHKVLNCELGNLVKIQKRQLWVCS